MPTLAAWGLVVALALVTIAAAYAVLVVVGTIGQRVAVFTGRGWVGAAIGLVAFAAIIGAEAWAFRDHISCGPSGCHEDSANPPEYP